MKSIVVRIFPFVLCLVSGVASTPSNSAEVELPVLGSANAKKGGNFQYNLRVAPATLNPITAHDNYGGSVRPWIVETLLTRHEDTYQWVPLLASRYQISKDQLTITFEIRDGVKFHDGSSLTADDVAFSMEVYGMNLYKTAGDSPAFENVERVSVIDAHKVSFKMKAMKFNNLDILAAIPIVPKAVYSNPAEIPKLSRKVIGTGPYRVKNYAIGEHLLLEANPDWWGRNLPFFRGKFNFNTITVHFASEPVTTILQLEKGELDYSELTTDMYDRDVSGPQWGKKVFAEHARYAETVTTQRSLFWNLRLPVFRDPMVRKALQLLYERNWINEKMLGGRSVLATGPWHRLNEYADPDVKPLEYDPKAAVDLLRAAGWQDSDHDGVLDKMIDGKKVDILLEKSEIETNRRKRISLLQKAYRIISEDASQLFMFSESESY